ncbi:unnamed protein product [Aureobasidium mustum]|uniref:Uncharacterized protein n=1 Tax=Aureobasidium mustum TaxID=2773714 RepID=A0A9N8K5V3_9PEZI|nr:unnamed protein product [Aureobasidium mustum]
MSARRFSGPPAATVAIKLDAARPRANSEPVAKYGAIGFSPEERDIARALHLQTNTFSNRGLAEKSWLLPLVESPFIPSPIPEEPEHLCEKVQDLIVTDKGELEWLACAQELPSSAGQPICQTFLGLLLSLQTDFRLHHPCQPRWHHLGYPFQQHYQLRRRHGRCCQPLHCRPCAQ